MKAELDSILPSEVRAIRTSLGLTQAEAGELIGGGPRAFAKYESGAVKPAAAVVRLLRLLEQHPKMLTSLAGRRSPPMLTGDVGPFEVTHQHVGALDARDLPRLLDRLLRSEYQTHDLSSSNVHASLIINAPDGGEDGHIRWEGGPERTMFLPSRHCVFQLKAGNIRPKLAGTEVLTRGKAVKPMVRSVLETGGTYVMLCTHPYTQASIQNREARIRDALQGTGLAIRDDQVVLYDAHRTAAWTNCHASVATWLKELTQPGTLGPFRSWTHWSGRPEHEVCSFVDDERLPPFRAFLRERVVEPRRIARIVGLAGIGKSRLAREALGPSEHEEETGFLPSDWVLYADESEVGSETVIKTVEVLGTAGQRAIVVVDGCPSETHRILQGIALRSESRLSLVTVDYHVPTGTLDPDSYKIEEAPVSVTDAIIDLVAPRLPSEDRRRIERFCAGFPKMATLVGEAWTQNRPVADATDEDLVDAFVAGRNPRDRDLLLRSAELLATFGLVGIHPADGNVAEVAALGRDLSSDDFHAYIQDLIARGVARRRGHAAVLQPRPIAMKLAERQWRSWSQARWDEVLAGGGDVDLKVLAARQLAWLNTTDIARAVVVHVCRSDGPLAGSDRISAPGNATVLSYLAEIDHEAVVEQIGRSLDGVEDLSLLSGEVRGDLASALEKIAFHPMGFDAGARLLLRLAVVRSNEYPANARGYFRDLFPLYLGKTAADGATRLSFLVEAADVNEPAQRLAIVDALSAGCTTGHFSRSVGAETHGSRPAMDSWQPATRDEISDYISGCARLLAQFAVRGDESAMEARRRLGWCLRGLVEYGFIDTVETIVRKVRRVIEPWPEGLKGLNHFLIYDAGAADADIVARVRTLISELTPEDLEAQVRLLVTEMPWDHFDHGDKDFAARERRQVEAVRTLAKKLIKQPEVLAGILPQVSRGPQRMAYTLGRALAELHDSPLAWLDSIVEAVSQEPEEEDDRNFDLLSGFLAGLASSEPDAVNAFKRRAAASPELAPAFPLICWRIGISPSDFELAVRALSVGLLTPWQLEQWSIGRCLEYTPPASIALLVDALLSRGDDGFQVTAILMHMYAHGAAERLEGLRPQIRRLAELFTRWERGVGFSIADHDFLELMKWMLAKGREDDDARATALTLAKAVAANEDHGSERCVKVLIPLLLEGFPEIVWPIFSQEIVSDDGRPWRMEYLLGERPSRDGETTPPILSLPDDSLFAWCHAHPDQAPAFVAGVVPPLASYKVEGSRCSLHPVVHRLLDEFGDRDDVQQAIRRCIHSFSWWGPVTGYFDLYEAPLTGLRDGHPRPAVRRWAKSTLRSLSVSRRAMEDRDDEWRAHWEI